ncbi:cdk5 and abl1 enzyme substrate 1-like [Lichtheimia corymbifera JMRC:FSU:9682]|uniref:Cdk5 and abl1 enzyme substrate 1-like n=1 Tax=Lichtheimia corymbifera JMRC:FSU:9682 TaxID=1263082 RepID=A0A068RF62_9FUNG|nr:cdk5 and abl1 enzyme substrate 1-like [Lichtheimia corymbifera JMRC:FSU:9682]
MGTTKSRKSRRNNSRPTAFTFLSNISLGNEQQQQQQQPADRQVISSAIVSPVSLESTHAKSLESIHNDHDPTAAPHAIHSQGIVGSLHSTDSNHGSEEHVFSGTAATHGIPCSSTAAPPSMATTPSVMTTAAAAAPGSLLSQQLKEQHKVAMPSRRRWSVDEDDVQHHKLTREDSERPIASEKIKKKSHHADKENYHGGLLSVVRYYTDKIRFPAGKRKAAEESINRGYLHQQLANHDSNKRRHALSYAHFLAPSFSLEQDPSLCNSTYDAYFLDNDTYNRFGLLSSSQGTTTAAAGSHMRPSDMKRELNEQFRLKHPEISPEITLSKIRAIKLHLLEIAKTVDLEISSVAHAFAYFEKLVMKNVVTKKNRKLIAACCLFLATKANEAKGTWFEPLFEAIDDELDVDSKEVRDHEFAVFADLEFNLYIPTSEFMPHFERIFQAMDYKSVEEYLGSSSFYKVDQSTKGTAMHYSSKPTAIHGINSFSNSSSSSSSSIE